LAFAQVIKEAGILILAVDVSREQAEKRRQGGDAAGGEVTKKPPRGDGS
jgi:hypothetical protein